MLWTLLIFFLCFLPGRDLPDIRVPFIDKWVHFVLFGAFALLWCLTTPGRRPRRLLAVFVAGCLLGWLVEIIQGHLPASFGRSQDNLDTLADSVGALLGVLLYATLRKAAVKTNAPRHPDDEGGGTPRK